MQQGVICIGVREPLDHDTLLDKVYRDGNWCVLALNEFVKRFGYLPAERFDYIEPARWMKAGLPKFGKHGASHTENTASDPTSASEEMSEQEETTPLTRQRKQYAKALAEMHDGEEETHA
jgi:hypothetical protein